MKTVDFDGEYSNSNIVAVNLKEGEVVLFPSSIDQLLSIRGNNIGKNQIEIIDLTGKNVTNQIARTNDSDNFIQLDFGRLTSGYYLVKVGKEVYPVIKE